MANWGENLIGVLNIARTWGQSLKDRTIWGA